jgi:putative hydrolase of the HAD superfamily
MIKISTIFFDVGGVCLSNGWDNIARKKAAKHFFLNYEEMEKRHKSVFKKFEKGKLPLEDYLNKVVFFGKRNFAKDDFISFMHSQSLEFSTTIKILKKLSAGKKYQLATINNESLELNEYRLNKFNLGRYFSCFFSSCYLGTRKPEKEIFYKALNIIHKKPRSCLFIDDREENIQSAQAVGLNTIWLQNHNELKEKLEEFNIET